MHLTKVKYSKNTLLNYSYLSNKNVTIFYVSHVLYVFFIFTYQIASLYFTFRYILLTKKYTCILLPSHSPDLNLLLIKSVYIKYIFNVKVIIMYNMFACNYYYQFHALFNFHITSKKIYVCSL